MAKIKSKIKNLEDCTRLFEIEISSDIVEKTLEEVYGDIKKVAKIPGYRPGTAPQDILEKHHSKDAEEELLKRLIPLGYKKALDEHGVAPISYPEVTDVAFKRGEPLSFKAKMNVKPRLRLSKYKGVRVKKNQIKVEDKEVEEAISRIQAINAKYITAEGRSVKKGDYVICDIEAFCEGKLITRKNENMWVIADKEASMLGLGEELVGMERGGSRDIKSRLPKDYADKRFQDKEAVFKIMVKEVKERKLPPIDDELAKDMGKENLAALREEIAKTLLQKKEESETINLENQILEALLKACKFSIPESMVDRQHRVLLKRFENELLSKGMHKDTVEEKKKEFSEKLKKDAENKVKVYFILDEVACKEGIQATAEDVDKRIAQIAKSTNQAPESVREYYKKNKLLDGMAEQIKEEKTLAFLLKNADIK